MCRQAGGLGASRNGALASSELEGAGSTNEPLVPKQLEQASHLDGMPLSRTWKEAKNRGNSGFGGAVSLAYDQGNASS